MVCKKVTTSDYTQLQHHCFMCSTKITTIDCPYCNLYGFSELVIRASTSVIGFRIESDGELYEGQYETTLSSHGFSPRDVNQDIFRYPEGKPVWDLIDFDSEWV